MADAQFYWSLFLETGAPEAYLSYKNAMAGKTVVMPDTKKEETHVLQVGGHCPAGN